MTTMDLQRSDAAALEFADSRPASFINEPAWTQRRVPRTDASRPAARRRFEPAPQAAAAAAAEAEASGWLARRRRASAAPADLDADLDAEIDAEIDALSAHAQTGDEPLDAAVLLRLVAGVAVSVGALAVACFLVGGL